MKKWKKVLLHVLIVLLVMAGVCGYFLFLYPHEQDFVESYYKVQSDQLTSHLRIVQLTCGSSARTTAIWWRGFVP